MEELPWVALCALFGVGSLLVGLFLAVARGRAQSAKIERLEREQRAASERLMHAFQRLEAIERANHRVLHAERERRRIVVRALRRRPAVVLQGAPEAVAPDAHEPHVAGTTDQADRKVRAAATSYSRVRWRRSRTSVVPPVRSTQPSGPIGDDGCVGSEESPPKLEVEELTQEARQTLPFDASARVAELPAGAQHGRPIQAPSATLGGDESAERDTKPFESSRSSEVLAGPSEEPDVKRDGEGAVSGPRVTVPFGQNLPEDTAGPSSVPTLGASPSGDPRNTLPFGPSPTPVEDRAAILHPPAEPPKAHSAEENRQDPQPTSPRPDWERWIGVRGAAAAGACILVLAGLYFFKYSIEQGLLAPWMRVLMGLATGLGCASASEFAFRRKATVLANWLSGAGVAILYIALWSAHGLHLIGAPLAFVAMVAVTALCGLLSVRHDAMAIALLGLAGGFVTPASLSSGEDHPLGLFGYLLLLDTALLYLAHRRKWPILIAFSLVATFLYEASWIGFRMGPSRLGLGVGIILVFALAFGFALPAKASRTAHTEPTSLFFTRGAAVFLPFGFGLYFGINGDLGPRLVPVGVLLVLLSAGASWVARAHRVFWIGFAAAVASVTVLGTWLLVHGAVAHTFEVIAVLVLLALVFHGFLEIEQRWPRDDQASPARGLHVPPGWSFSAYAASAATLGGMFLAIVVTVAMGEHTWAWIATFIVLGAIGLRQSLFEGRGAARTWLGAFVALGFPLVDLRNQVDGSIPEGHIQVSALAPTAGLVLLAAALLSRDPQGSLSAPSRSRRSRRGRALLADEINILLPLVSALYFAIAARGPHLALTSVLLFLVLGASAYVVRVRSRSSWLCPIASAAVTVVLLAWIGRHDAGVSGYETAAILVLLPLVPHGFLERARMLPLDSWLPTGAAISALGSLGVLAFAGSVAPSFLVPWILGTAALVALVLRQASVGSSQLLHPGLAVLLGLGIALVHVAHLEDPMSSSLFLAIGTVAATSVQIVASLRSARSRKLSANHGAAALALLLLLNALIERDSGGSATAFFGATLALGLLALLSAAQLGSGGWVLATVVGLAFTQTVWSAAHLSASDSDSRVVVARTALLGLGLTSAAVTAFPLFYEDRFALDPWAFRAAALMGPLLLPISMRAFHVGFGDRALGLVPLGYGSLTALAALRLRATPKRGPVAPVGTTLPWFWGVSLAAVTLSIPFQLENEWVTIGWAIEGAACMALFARVDHVGLKYASLTHLAVAVARLVLNPAVLAYHAPSRIPVFNWLCCAFGVPLLALLAAHRFLGPVELRRQRPWEKQIYRSGTPVFTRILAAVVVIVGFVWLNLTIFDAFETGAALSIPAFRMPARDLVLSVGWALYALGLLAIGMRTKSPALRWTSLALMIITVGKVFLYDLSHLRDLYRVVSLVGLSLSLIAISLAYQRVVFVKQERR